MKNLNEILALRHKKTVKDDGSFVTEGDILCQKIVVGYAKSISANFDVVSEEMNLEDFLYDKQKNYIVLDPIDGTENFTSGLKEWGISVSVFKMGKHHESMMMLPELNLCLTTGDKLVKHASRIYGLSSSLAPRQLSNLKEGYEYRIMGCCVFNMYNVISGSFKVFENPNGAHAWDILAGLNLALEHGLNVTVGGEGYRGEFLDPTKKHPFKIGNKNG